MSKVFSESPLFAPGLIRLYFKRVEVDFYYPRLMNNDVDFGVVAKACFLIKTTGEYTSVAIVFGLGFGVSFLKD